MEKRFYKMEDNELKYPIYVTTYGELVSIGDHVCTSEVLTEKCVLVLEPQFSYEDYMHYMRNHFQKCTDLLYPSETILAELKKENIVFNSPRFYKSHFSEVTVDEARKFYDSLTLNSINAYLQMLTEIQDKQDQEIIALINEKRIKYTYSMIHNPNSILGKKYTLRK